MSSKYDFGLFKNISSFKLWNNSIILVIISLLTFSTLFVDAKIKDGKIATVLNEYHSTIKCVANIAEDTLPELDDYVGCCGFWAIHDFLLHKVEKECDKKNLDQVKGMSAVVSPGVRAHCAAYPQGSFTCRLLIIMPITFAVLFVIFFVSVNVCACVMFFKWKNARSKYRKVCLQEELPTHNSKKSQNLDSEYRKTSLKGNSKLSNNNA